MSKQIKADAFLLGITVIWGILLYINEKCTELNLSFAYLSMRFIIATVILIIIFHKKIKNINRKTMIYGCLIGLMLFGTMAFQVIGLKTTTASNSAFITGLNVVMVPVISAMLLKKRPGLTSVIGVLLAFGGLFFLWGGFDVILSKGDSFKFVIGDLFTLFCAICCTFQIIFIDKFTDDHDPALLAVIQIGFAAILYSGLWVAIDYKPFVINTSVVITLLITGVLGTALAFAGQAIVQKFTSPTHTALIFTAEPRIWSCICFDNTKCNRYN